MKYFICIGDCLVAIMVVNYTWSTKDIRIRFTMYLYNKLNKSREDCDFAIIDI